MPDLIERAVRSRHLLLCNYHCYSRIIEPHVLADRGERLVAFQISGGSEDGEWIGWKDFRIAEIAGASVLAEHFERRSPDSAILSRYFQAGALRAFGGGGHARGSVLRPQALEGLANALQSLDTARRRVEATQASVRLQVERGRDQCTSRVRRFWAMRAAWPPAHFPAHFV